MREWINWLRGESSGVVLALILLGFDTASALAQQPVSTLPALDEQNLSRFAESWAPVADAISAADKEFDRTRPVTLVQSLTALAQADGTGSALDGLVLKFGYTDFEFWAAFATRAIEAAQWARQPPTEDELKRTIRALESDPDIPAEQKQSLIDDVSTAFRTALANKPSDADIAAAKAVLPLLKPIITPDE